MTSRAPSGKNIPARGASGTVYPISLCMIVRNEERFLGDALTSVQGVVDEMCIVDSGSTDRTVAIAESFGAKISFITWRDDFAWARNTALEMATGKWIFVLDADERLAPDSREKLAALRHVRPDGFGRWLRCRNFSDGEREEVASTNAIIRIFPNDPAIRYRGTIHEYVARDGDEHSLTGAMTPIEILHYGYQPAVMAERGKGDRNLRVSRAAFEAAPDDPPLVYNYAMSALLAKDRDAAREQLERLTELTRGTPRGFRPMALSTLSGIYLEDGRAADALATADECTAIVATLPDGHYARGRALAALGRLDEARTAFEEAIRVGSNATYEHFVVDDEIAAWKAYNEIGGTYMRQHRFAEARETLERGLEVRPSESALLLNRARCCEAQGDIRTALPAFRTLFEMLRNETAAIEYVNYVFRHGTPDDQLDAVESTLSVLGEDYQMAFLTSAAAAMVRVGRRDEAAALLERVLAAGNPAKGRAIVKTLAQQYGVPELNGLLTAPGRVT